MNRVDRKKEKKANYGKVKSEIVSIGSSLAINKGRERMELEIKPD